MNIPVTILSGYLGAGKTTLINHLLTVSQGARITVLVNDFGAVNVDASLIAQRGRDTIALSNGCACCSIGDDLGMALEAQVRRTDQPERILIEASGVAEPARVRRTAESQPGLRLEAVVTVVDASAVQERARDKYVGRLVQRQIAAAHAIVVNKSDLVTGEKAARLRAWLTDLAPAARLARAERGRVDPSFLVAGRRDSGNPVGVWDDATDTRFHTRAIAFPEPVDIADLQVLLVASPSSVHRVKGFVRDADEAHPMLVQYAGAEMSAEPMAQGASVPSLTLVVIGTNVDELDAFASRLGGLAAGLAINSDFS